LEVDVESLNPRGEDHSKSLTGRGWNHFQRSADKHAPFVISWWPFDPPPCTKEQRYRSASHVYHDRHLLTKYAENSRHRTNSVRYISVPAASYDAHRPHRQYYARGYYEGWSSIRGHVHTHQHRCSYAHKIHRHHIHSPAPHPPHYHKHNLRQFQSSERSTRIRGGAFHSHSRHHHLHPSILLCFDMSKTARSKDKEYCLISQHIKNTSDAKSIFEKFRKEYFKNYGLFTRTFSWRFLAGIEVAKVCQPYLLRLHHG
jgi:hypothetical protein